MLGLQADQLIGERYRVVRFLAKGGMASVFEVEHRLTEKRLALKILHPHILDNRAARDSFEFEAKVAARVDSPYVVQVMDAGFEVQGNADVPYLVMELLSGETLEARVDREGPLPPKSVLSWLKQIARGLDAAHSHRGPEGQSQPIIHRDLKPDNIFLHATPTGEMAKILDFGIAKLITHSAQTSQTIRGTPLYISYEQLVGRQVSSKTDIWSLGLIAFTLLTGKSYWLSASRSEARTESLFAEIVTLPLEPPSIRVRQLGLVGSLPSGFDEWFLRCIDRNPDARYASATSAIARMEEVLAAGTLAIKQAESTSQDTDESWTEQSSAPEMENTLPSSVPSPKVDVVPAPPNPTATLASLGRPERQRHSPQEEQDGSSSREVAEAFSESHPAVSSSRKPTRQASRSKPWLWISAAAVAILGVGVAGWNVSQTNTPKEQEQAAQLEGEVVVQVPAAPLSTNPVVSKNLREPSLDEPSSSRVEAPPPPDPASVPRPPAQPRRSSTSPSKSSSRAVTESPAASSGVAPTESSPLGATPPDQPEPVESSKKVLDPYSTY